MSKYNIELTEEQMRVTMLALEEYFRPRIGRTYSQDAVDGLMKSFRNRDRRSDGHNKRRSICDS